MLLNIFFATPILVCPSECDVINKDMVSYVGALPRISSPANLENRLALQVGK